jgi:hypothetical protein
MYAFSEDEKHLLFMDGFGLTRLSRPKAVKTDPKISGSESGGLISVARDGSVAASYEDLWDKSVIWEFPALKPSQRFDRFRERGAMIVPAGTHYAVIDDDALRLTPLRKGVLLPMRLDAPPEPRERSNEPVSLTLAGGEQRPALALGGDGALEVPAPLRFAHDGTLLWLRRGELICASLVGTEASVRWRRAVTGPAGARLELLGDAERCLLIVHHGRRWSVCELRGEHERRFEIDSVAVPAAAGRYLAWQPSATTIVRRDLDSEALDEYTLGPAHAGPTTLFAGGKGSLLALPCTREALVDLISGVEISRKLPAKLVELRQAFVALSRPYVEAARASGSTIELGRVEFNPKYNSVSITHRIAGPPSVPGALLAGYSQAVYTDVALPGGWRMSSYGSHGSIEYDRELELDALVDAYTELAAVGLDFASTIGFWSRAYERYGRPPRVAACSALLAQAMLAVVRDGPADPLDFAALAKRGAPSLDELLEVYRVQFSDRSRTLDSAAARLSAGLFNHVYGAEAARLWVPLVLDEDGVDPRRSAHFELAHYGLSPLIAEHPQVAEQVRAWFASHPMPSDERAHALGQLRDQLG